MTDKLIKEVICCLVGLGPKSTGGGGFLTSTSQDQDRGSTRGGRMRGGQSGSSTEQVLLKTRYQKPPNKSPP